MRLITNPYAPDSRTATFAQVLFPNPAKVFSIVLRAFAGSLLMLVLMVANQTQDQRNGWSLRAPSITQALTMPPVHAKAAMTHGGSPPLSPAPPAAPPPAAAAAPVSQLVSLGSLPSTLTFYDCIDQGFCGAMYNGEPVYEGAAACSWDLAIGTTFTIPGDPTGRIYVCKDRGLLPDTHVDIFWHHPDDGWRWQAAVGSQGTIELIAQVPPGPGPDIDPPAQLAQ